MAQPSPFGLRLLQIRKHRELTQEQLAAKARIPAAVVSHFETGVRSNASAGNLVKLADALRVSVDYLLGRTDDMTPVSGGFDKRAAELTDEKWELLESVMDHLARSSKRENKRKK